MTEDNVGDGAPLLKKAREGDIDVSELPPQPVAKRAPARKKAEVTPRTALPDRPGCNVHSAAQPTKCHSSQEVATKCEAKWKAIEDKIQEGKKVKQLLAEFVPVKHQSKQLNKDDDNEWQRKTGKKGRSARHA